MILGIVEVSLAYKSRQFNKGSPGRFIYVCKYLFNVFKSYRGATLIKKLSNALKIEINLAKNFSAIHLYKSNRMTNRWTDMVLRHS